jgi:hypothetical protein
MKYGDENLFFLQFLCSQMHSGLQQQQEQVMEEANDITNLDEQQIITVDEIIEQTNTNEKTAHVESLKRIHSEMRNDDSPNREVGDEIDEGKAVTVTIPRSLKGKKKLRTAKSK